MSVGVDAIDKDHKRLVSLVNALYDAICTGTTAQSPSVIFDDLVGYTKDHFVREERLFVGTEYPGSDAHKKEHAQMVDWLLEMKSEYEMGTAVAPSLRLMCNLKDWLFDHILGPDQAYAPYLKRSPTQLTASN